MSPSHEGDVSESEQGVKDSFSGLRLATLNCQVTLYPLRLRRVPSGEGDIRLCLIKQDLHPE